jgi:hypothetical protein
MLDKQTQLKYTGSRHELKGKLATAMSLQVIIGLSCLRRQLTHRKLFLVNTFMFQRCIEIITVLGKLHVSGHTSVYKLQPNVKDNA